MFTGSIKRHIGKWLVVSALLGFGFAMAQSEPTLKQVYAEAQAGRLEQAQVMMQQVLVAHPGSAKAHFVQAELSARQGKMSHAREALASAEKLAPGLAFAKPEAVQALRTQLAAKNSAPANNGSNSNSSSRAPATVAPAAYSAPAAPASSFPWGLALALGGGAIAIGIFLTRKKAATAAMPPAAYANPAAMPGGLNGQQGFGMANTMGNNAGGGAVAPGFGQQPGYGQQPAYGQPAGMGLGGKVMGGLATGLAVGAGVMAAQAIGKSLMGHDTPPAQKSDTAANNGVEPLASNNDLGGQNFGVNDTSSWDDGDALASSGDGGDWDS
ncbi:hypothetical protein [Rhodoferax ferrireducens]|uniref:hypothetical protein n=1 Tax=Rhodoferax ferrireducens TaxID=192843 RepID=UPI000E0CE46C|nr:hypothetical protein [Rhodoferax ferrireducens]